MPLSPKTRKKKYKEKVRAQLDKAKESSIRANKEKKVLVQELKKEREQMRIRYDMAHI